MSPSEAVERGDGGSDKQPEVAEPVAQEVTELLNDNKNFPPRECKLDPTIKLNLEAVNSVGAFNLGAERFGECGMSQIHDMLRNPLEGVETKVENGVRIQRSADGTVIRREKGNEISLTMRHNGEMVTVTDRREEGTDRVTRTMTFSGNQFIHITPDGQYTAFINGRHYQGQYGAEVITELTKAAFDPDFTPGARTFKDGTMVIGHEDGFTQVSTRNGEHSLWIKDEEAGETRRYTVGELLPGDRLKILRNGDPNDFVIVQGVDGKFQWGGATLTYSGDQLQQIEVLRRTGLNGGPGVNDRLIHRDGSWILSSSRQNDPQYPNGGARVETMAPNVLGGERAPVYTYTGDGRIIQTTNVGADNLIRTYDERGNQIVHRDNENLQAGTVNRSEGPNGSLVTTMSGRDQMMSDGTIRMVANISSFNDTAAKNWTTDEARHHRYWAESQTASTVNGIRSALCSSMIPDQLYDTSNLRDFLGRAGQLIDSLSKFGFMHASLVQVLQSTQAQGQCAVMDGELHNAAIMRDHTVNTYEGSVRTASTTNLYHLPPREDEKKSINT